MTGVWCPEATVDTVARGIPTATTWLPLIEVSDGLTAVDAGVSAVLRVLLLLTLLAPTTQQHTKSAVTHGRQDQLRV